MKRLLLILTLAVIPFAALRAQNDELNRLTDIVTSLRTGGEAAYNRAITALGADSQWTPMDELAIDRKAECRVSDRVPGFRLNSVMTNAENAQRYQTTTGNHLNGADSRFNYSLYEKTLKAGMEAEYSLAERWGEQTFIFIPFSGTEGSLQASVSAGGGKFKSTSLGNGILRFTGKVKRGDPVKLHVGNKGEQPISYVIINYNSRR